MRAISPVTEMPAKCNQTYLYLYNNECHRQDQSFCLSYTPCTNECSISMMVTLLKMEFASNI